MAVELKVPEMGESVTEVFIGQWQKREGDRVDQDDPLVEIESDKATLDLRAPSAGVLTKILKQSGEAAEVGEVIGELDVSTDGKKPAAAEDAKAEQPKAEKPTAAEKAEKKEVTKKPSESEQKAKPAAETAAKAPEAAKAKPESVGKEAAESTEKVEKKGAAVEKAEVKTEKKAEAKTQKRADAAEAAARGEERVVMSPIRRRIAARLVEAQANAALLTTFNEVDMSAVKQLRSQHGEAFERRHGVRLGFMSFFVKAAVEALRQCPELNAMIDGDDIVYRRFYDIGVAISTDKGLVVPILRDVDRMGFARIEQSIEELSKRARSGDLKVDELQGGTFTITNGGVFGSLLSTPIVNPPQSGVLGMHAIQNRPVAVDNQVVIRPMMYIALTYDHRIVDGREAVTFLRRIKETIEEPTRMLIEA
jgi:2-oxoglutarate dehydrogenase E2 component (dihydrolipoamide succinyltransferase)